jgi:cephalosporin-C deacetylase-like acetyl esterase
VLAALLPAASSGTPGGSLFDYDSSLPLHVSWGGTTTSNGIVRQSLTFAGARGARLAAFFVHPADGGPWPLVLWTPGRGGNRTEELPDATTLARNGVASLLVNPPAPEVVTCKPAKDLAIFVRYVIGRRRAVDLALTLPNIDGGRLAAAGFSFGASVTADLAGVEHRVRVFALKSGRAHHTGFMRLACAQLGPHKLDDYVKKLAAVDPINWISRAASGSAFLVQDGTRDPWNPRSDVRALYAAAHGTKELRFYPAEHELNAAASAERRTWLLRQLRR